MTLLKSYSTTTTKNKGKKDTRDDTTEKGILLKFLEK